MSFNVSIPVNRCRLTSSVPTTISVTFGPAGKQKTLVTSNFTSAYNGTPWNWKNLSGFKISVKQGSCQDPSYQITGYTVKWQYTQTIGSTVNTFEGEPRSISGTAGSTTINFSDEWLAIDIVYVEVTAIISGGPTPVVTTYTITTTVDQEIGGSIYSSDNGTSWTNQGVYYQKTGITTGGGTYVKPMPADGYEFVKWIDMNGNTDPTWPTTSISWHLVVDGSSIYLAAVFERTATVGGNVYRNGAWEKSLPIRKFSNGQWTEIPVHIYRNGQWEEL